MMLVFVKTGDAAKRGDRATHLAAFKGAEKSDGDAGGARNLGEGKFAAHPEAAKALAGKLRRVGGGGDDALFFEDVHDGGGIPGRARGAGKCALQQADVGFGVHAVTALGALWRNEAEGFPGAQCGRGNRKPAGHCGNAQKGLGGPELSMWARNSFRLTQVLAFSKFTDYSKVQPEVATTKNLAPGQEIFDETRGESKNERRKATSAASVRLLQEHSMGGGPRTVQPLY